MNTGHTNEVKLKCDACRKETSRDEIKYLSLKTCCSVQRIPLCPECYDKYAPQKNRR